MNDHSEPTYKNQLWHARKLLAEKGRNALNNPHAMIGRTCRCGSCFCCAAAEVLRDAPTYWENGEARDMADVRDYWTPKPHK